MQTYVHTYIVHTIHKNATCIHTCMYTYVHTSADFAHNTKTQSVIIRK